jgi:hypothetical protein
MKYVIMLAMYIAIGLLITYPLMWAINYTFAPGALIALFGVSQLTFWKTFTLSVVTGWLFSRGSGNGGSK